MTAFQSTLTSPWQRILSTQIEAHVRMRAQEVEGCMRPAPMIQNNKILQSALTSLQQRIHLAKRQAQIGKREHEDEGLDLCLCVDIAVTSIRTQDVESRRGEERTS